MLGKIGGGFFEGKVGVDAVDSVGRDAESGEHGLRVSVVAVGGSSWNVAVIGKYDVCVRITFFV